MVVFTFISQTWLHIRTLNGNGTSAVSLTKSWKISHCNANNAHKDELLHFDINEASIQNQTIQLYSATTDDCRKVNYGVSKMAPPFLYPAPLIAL